MSLFKLRLIIIITISLLIAGLSTASYLAGKNRASAQCQQDKVAAIVSGLKSRNEIDQHVFSLEHNDIVNELGDIKFLRD